LPKIVVLVKYTPDLTSDRSFLPDGTVDRAGVPGRLSELDEHAAEQALQVQESSSAGWELVYLTMGPEGASDALRKALSMGGDGAVHVRDDALHGSDAFATSLVLAEAIKRIGFDLVVTGMASTDAGMGVVPALLAERLGVPQVTFAGKLSVSGDEVQILRDSDTSSETVTARLPAIVSVTDRTGEARYPSFKGIMAAKKKPVETLSLADLGIDSGLVGLAGARTTVLSTTRRPARSAGQLVKDDGEGGKALADFLAAQRFI
jgi:electron transfer flavoprotein beta subunit